MAITKKVKFYDKNDRVSVEVTIETNDDGTTRIITPDGHQMYPMDIRNIQWKSDLGLDPDLIVKRTVGENKRLSYMVPVKEELYRPIIAPEKAADKCREREGKCPVPGKRGGSILCREASCRKAREEGRCPYPDGYGMKRLVFVADPNLLRRNEGCDSTADTAISNVMYEEFLDFLTKIAPKLADVYRLQQEGYHIREIAEMMHLNQNTVGGYSRRAKKLKIEFEM